MFFFPYRIDIPIFRLPLLTILTAVLCILVFLMQASNQAQFDRSLDNFCKPDNRQIRVMLAALHMPAATSVQTQKSCFRLMTAIHASESPKAFIDTLVDKVVTHPEARFRDRELITWLVTDVYDQFREIKPGNYLTGRLWYKPDGFKPLSMLTSVFSHADWSHLLGNLFVLIAFAVSIESILGHGRFLASFLAITVGSNTVYMLVQQATDNIVPTIGISGVVMGMLGLAAWFVPWAKVRCFFWLFVYYRVFLFPVWLFVLWFLGWDIYKMLTGDGTGGVNLVAHVSGAVIGYLLGMLFFRERKQRLQVLRYAS